MSRRNSKQCESECWLGVHVQSPQHCAARQIRCLHCVHVRPLRNGVQACSATQRKMAAPRDGRRRGRGRARGHDLAQRRAGPVRDEVNVARGHHADQPPAHLAGVCHAHAAAAAAAAPRLAAPACKSQEGVHGPRHMVCVTMLSGRASSLCSTHAPQSLQLPVQNLSRSRPATALCSSSCAVRPLLHARARSHSYPAPAGAALQGALQTHCLLTRTTSNCVPLCWPRRDAPCLTRAAAQTHAA